MFQKLKEKATAAAADPRLDKTKAGLKKAETGLWKALEPVGKWSNKTAGKLGAESFWPTSMDLECDKAARILRTFTSTGAHADADPSADATGGVLGGATKTPQQLEAERKLHKYDERKTQKVIKKIPQEVIASAKGLAIFTVFRTGFGLSGAGGSGVVVKRLPDGSWSGPSGLLLHTIGWGFLIGLDIYDVVLVLRTDKAVEAFRNPKISVGAEIAVAAGPVGSGAMLDSGPEASPAFSYVKSKGFYAGLQLDGNIILKRKDENSRFYNIPDVSTADIFAGRIPPPRGAYPLLKTIYAAEGRAPPSTVTHFGSDVVIPEGPTPGDLNLTAEEAAMLEEEAKKQQGFHEQGQAQAQAYGAGAGVGPSGSTGSTNVGGTVPVHSAMGTAIGAGAGTTTSALASSGYAPPASNPYGGGSGYAPPTSNPYGGGHGQQTFQDTSSAAPAHYVPGPGGGPEGAGVLAAAAVGAGVGAGVASASHSAGVQPDRKQSELWEQPPPDYDFSTAPPAATQNQYQQQPPPVPATGATSLHDPFQDQAQAPLPPPSSAPLTAEQEKEQLRQRHENQALPPPPPPPVQAAGPSAPLSAEEEKELLKKRHEAEAAANASGGASGSGAPPYPQGPSGQGNNPPGGSNQWYDHSDIVHLPQ